MSKDPASLDVSLSFSGLSTDEIGVLVRNVPEHAQFKGTRTRPPIGAPRFMLEVTNLTIMGAAQLSADFLRYVQTIAEDDG